MSEGGGAKAESAVNRLRVWLIAFTVACVMASPVSAQTPRMRGITTVAEQRVALVIGNAAYRVDPLDNPVNDARLVAQSLRKAGFGVRLHENLDRGALVEALREFGSRLSEDTIAVLYYAGHGLQLRDRNFLIPIDAEIRSEDEIPIAGVDIGFVLGRMSSARSRINIVILDACRNNPFAGKGGRGAQGLAQMDAPVGTLLAYATAPGKLAADSGSSGSGLYATHLARHLLTPGLPVEHVFKRVREAVVRETREAQVPWESSSLQGEFAFVPGSAPQPVATADVEAAGELAFWNSIQGSTRADEFRAYLRQYPNGRFAALAQSRLAAFSVTPSAQRAGDTLPRVGDSWRYRVQDQFRIGDLYLTAKVDSVGAGGVGETWSTTSDAFLRTTLVPLQPVFSALPGWNLSPPEFAPYLLAAGTPRRGEVLAEQTRQLEEHRLALRGRIEGEEEVTVPAGRFRTIKLVLKGQASARGSRAVSTEQVVWYSPEVKRSVKTTVETRAGGTLLESTSIELVEFRLN